MPRPPHGSGPAPRSNVGSNGRDIGHLAYVGVRPSRPVVIEVGKFARKMSAKARGVIAIVDLIQVDVPQDVRWLGGGRRMP